MPSKNRIIYIDIARAIAIILVVIGHYIPQDHPDWYGEMRSVIYGFHMPLFMFASGLVYNVTFRKEKYGIFLYRKIKRLLIPYFVVSFLIITMKLLSQGNLYVENPVTLFSYIRVFYMPEAGYFTWFVWALWWMFVIIPFFDSKRKRLFLFVLSVLLYFLPLNFPEIFCLKEFKRMLIFFVLGCVSWDWRRNLDILKQIPIYMYVLLFVITNYIKIVDCIGNQRGENLIISLVGIGFVFSICRWLDNKGWVTMKNLLLKVASSSYVIYLLHTTFEGFAKAIVVKAPIIIASQDPIMFSIRAIIVVSFGILVPLLLDVYVIRRLKATRFLFGYK